MTWSKFDDGFHSHPKIVQVGNAGAGLYAKAITYCSHYLTDGVVPGGWVRAQLSKSERDLPEKLAAAGLWEPSEEGFVVHDYLEFHASRVQVLSQRKKDAVRKESERNPNGNRAESKRPIPIPTSHRTKG